MQKRLSWMIPATVFFLISVNVRGVRAEPADYHIVSAGVNLGWLAATVEHYEGVPAAAPYQGAAVANAVAHLAAADAANLELYDRSLGLGALAPEVAAFLGKTAEWTPQQRVNEIHSIIGKILAKLDIAWDEAGRKHSRPSCKGRFLEVGYHFGRAHIGALVDDGGYRGSAHSGMLIEIEAGLRIQQTLPTPEFNAPEAWATWGEPFARTRGFDTYSDNLYPLQVIAWTANAFSVAPPPAPTGPSLMPPLPPPGSSPPGGGGTGGPRGALTIPKHSFVLGEKIQVSFTAAADFHKSAWIGVIPSHVEHGSEAVNDGHDLAYEYIDGRTSGVMTFTAPAKAGSYDLRMNDSDNGGKEVASVSFTCGGVLRATVVLDKTEYRPGEVIEVRFTAPGSYPNSAWVGIVPSHVAHGEEAVNDRHDIQFQHLSGRVEGLLRFEVPGKPGNYDMRMNDNDSNGREVASVSFVVTR